MQRKAAWDVALLDSCPTNLYLVLSRYSLSHCHPPKYLLFLHTLTHFTKNNNFCAAAAAAAAMKTFTICT